MRDNLIPRTSNKAEKEYSISQPNETKHKYKTINGVLEYLALNMTKKTNIRKNSTKIYNPTFSKTLYIITIDKTFFFTKKNQFQHFLKFSSLFDINSKKNIILKPNLF